MPEVTNQSEFKDMLQFYILDGKYATHMYQFQLYHHKDNLSDELKFDEPAAIFYKENWATISRYSCLLSIKGS